MKTKTLLLSSLLVIPTMALLTSSTIDSNGKLGNSGALGESTCSQSGCHGAGNGSSSTGGLADNAGPGNITLTSTPALTANNYVSNTVYHITITVSETGKSLFGFDFEALDNSGNTNASINNSVGTVTITDATHTRKGQPFGTGRLTVTHQHNGGAFANSATFNFDWTAPASGTVNFYYDGNAVNNDGLANAQDNVYAKTLQLTPALATNINAVNATNFAVETYPNPINDVFTIRFQIDRTQNVDAQLFSVDGKLIKNLFNTKAPAGLFTESFSAEGITKGLYLLRTTIGGQTQTKRVFVN
ncbi:MAG: choice-of-anchor V domain-containing protein [Bacteroidia bacterium]